MNLRKSQKVENVDKCKGFVLVDLFQIQTFVDNLRKRVKASGKRRGDTLSAFKVNVASKKHSFEVGEIVFAAGHNVRNVPLFKQALEELSETPLVKKKTTNGVSKYSLTLAGLLDVAQANRNVSRIAYTFARAHARGELFDTVHFEECLVDPLAIEHKHDVRIIKAFKRSQSAVHDRYIVRGVVARIVLELCAQGLEDTDPDIADVVALVELSTLQRKITASEKYVYVTSLALSMSMKINFI